MRKREWIVWGLVLWIDHINICSIPSQFRPSEYRGIIFVLCAINEKKKIKWFMRKLSKYLEYHYYYVRWVWLCNSIIVYCIRPNSCFSATYYFYLSAIPRSDVCFDLSSQWILHIIFFFFVSFIHRIMNYVTRRFLRCAMVVFSWFVVPYSRVTTLWVPRKKLPPITNPLLEIKAVKLAEMIRLKQVSQQATRRKQFYTIKSYRIFLYIGNQWGCRSSIHWSLQRSESTD